MRRIAVLGGRIERWPAVCSLVTTGLVTMKDLVPVDVPERIGSLPVTG
jgi:hypothetical protein